MSDDDLLSAFFTAKVLREGAFETLQVARKVFSDRDAEYEIARHAAILAVGCPDAGCTADAGEGCKFGKRETHQTHVMRDGLSGVEGPNNRQFVINKMEAGAVGYRRVQI